MNWFYKNVITAWPVVFVCGINDFIKEGKQQY